MHCIWEKKYNMENHLLTPFKNSQDLLRKLKKKKKGNMKNKRIDIKSLKNKIYVDKCLHLKNGFKKLTKI